MSVEDPHGRLERCRLALSTFDFTVVFRPGLKKVPDALSSCVELVGTPEELEHRIYTYEDAICAITRTGTGRAKSR